MLLPTDDGKGVQPGLATSWKVAPDGMLVTLTLRRGARFSDGTPITAGDVKWSLDRARDPGHGIWNFLLGGIGAVEIADPGTVVLRMRHPDPAILAALSVFNSAIMPERQFLASPGRDDDERAVAFERHPVTSGPFVLRSWTHGSTMRLRRNPFYWRLGVDGRPLPYLDGIDFAVVPDDATRLLKVQSGELDGAELVPFSRIAELRRDSRLKLVLFASTRVWYASVNARPTLPNGLPNPLASARVRQALDEAVDRRGLIQIATQGIGTEMTSYMSHATPLHVDVARASAYDPAGARGKLRDAGYPHGFAVTIQILAGNEDEIEIATGLQEWWSAIGVTLHIRQLDAGTWTELYRTGAFMMNLSFWTDDIADPDEVTSYDVYGPTIGALHSGWDSKAADALFLASGTELDPVRRAADYARIQAIYADGPVLRLYESPYAVVLRREVMGFVQLPLGNNVFSGAWIAPGAGITPSTRISPSAGISR